MFTKDEEDLLNNNNFFSVEIDDLTIDCKNEELSRLRKYLDDVKRDKVDNDNDDNRDDKDHEYDKDGDDDDINANIDEVVIQEKSGQHITVILIHTIYVIITLLIQLLKYQLKLMISR